MTSTIIAMAQTLLVENNIPFSGLRQMIARSDFRERGKVLLLLFEDGLPRPSHVVKLARSEYAREALRHERTVYSEIMRRSELIRRSRPRLYLDRNDTVFVLEPFVPGGTIRHRVGNVLKEVLANDWLSNFQRDTADGTLTTVDLLPELQATIRFLRSTSCTRLADSMESRANTLPEFELPRVAVHGDFTPSNVLVDTPGVFVTDWEWAKIHGWPLEDLWVYLIVAVRHRRFGRRREASRLLAENLAGSGPHSKSMANACLDFSRTNGYLGTLHPFFALVVLCRMAGQEDDTHRDWRPERSGFYSDVLLSLEECAGSFWTYWETSMSGTRLDRRA